MALLLHLRLRTTIKSNTSLLRRLFSTSNSGSGDQAPPNSNSPYSSFFGEVKDSLKQRSAKSQEASLDEIQKNVSQFRALTSAPSPPQQISFQKIYSNRLAQEKSTDFNVIRESLRNFGNRKGATRTSPEALKKVIGGTNALPELVFGRELRERKEGDGSSATKMGFVRTYKYEELGEKLRMLRPQGNAKGKDWFSLSKLNERLTRLREIEENEATRNSKGAVYAEVRDCLVRLDEAKKDDSKKASMQRLNILGQLAARTPYSLEPPKEHLVERYFHPDNMSSAEKMKIELAKIREEFKMSESDCGSARVQVAQLTTKIKHLSAVLHKKDVHSRKGLLAMVQRRKSLLKYLRRTDWDSYCFVISKLGLRDNPDYSNKIRSSRSGLAASS
ncbi:uncharacterized protein LOC113857119 [Abrus precatorius]|uniref:Small ribosomal subunit protein uS15c n=1 Tax=Abrus precatorius TaxID=3816 RepID=A0A8B8KPN1_ABRPR|nr:uncharacterized protein LOC113857119 [Abrus precatorius]